MKRLERAHGDRPRWSPGFFERLRDVDEATAAAVDEMLASILEARRSKDPQRR